MRYLLFNPLIVLFVILIVPCIRCAGQDQLKIKNEQFLDEIVKAYITQNDFSGTILIGQGDKIIYSKSSGQANYEHQVPNTLSTKFRLASLSKQFTAAALLILEQKGIVDFQSPISKYLPDLKPAISEKTTIHQILSHSSGLARDIESLSDDELGKKYISIDQIISLINTTDLLFPPGEKWAYSNLGYALAAAIIEKSMGMEYGSAMDKLIFSPMKMANTGHEKSSAVLSNMATGYVALPDGIIKAAYEDKSYVIGAGSIYSTAEDLFIWSRTLLSGTLISKENTDRLFTRQSGRYGYGWFIDTYVWPPVNDDHQALNPHHEGGCPGFESKLSLLTKHDIAVIILSNKLPSSINSLSNQLTNASVGFDEALPQPDGTQKFYRSLFDNGIEATISLINSWKDENKKYLIPSRGDIFLVGRGYMDAQEYTKATLIMDLLIRMIPKWSYPYLFKAIMLENQNKSDEAAKLYQKVLEIDPEQSNAIQRLKRLKK